MANFQRELGAVSAEIEILQTRSTNLNTRLENRKVIEQLLGPAVEEILIPPPIFKTLSQGPIDQTWVEALSALEKKSTLIEAKLKRADGLRAAEDLKPLLEKLTQKVIERIRDYLVSQIKALRSPNINAQVIQQNGLDRFKDLFIFLAKHHRQLAEEIAQAYINTMRWYYLSHFMRYREALDKIPRTVVDRSDALGVDPSHRGGLASKNPDYHTNTNSQCCKVSCLFTRCPIPWPAGRHSQPKQRKCIEFLCRGRNAQWPTPRDYLPLIQSRPCR